MRFLSVFWIEIRNHPPKQTLTGFPIQNVRLGTRSGLKDHHLTKQTLTGFPTQNARLETRSGLKDHHLTKQTLKGFAMLHFPAGSVIRLNNEH